MAETNNDVKTDEFKSWKKPELQKWLSNHGLKVTGTKQELEVRVESAKRAGVETVVGNRVLGGPKGRSKRRSTHMPNLTDELGTAEEQRLNQFGSAG